MSRKGFNFYRGYFDVAMELQDKDRHSMMQLQKKSNS